MEEKKQMKKANLLPFHIIKAASEGNVEAINEVVDHYEGYIIKLSIRKMYDEYEYSRAVTPQVRQTGNRLSGLAGTAYASLLA